jgi:hypothetical protein
MNMQVRGANGVLKVTLPWWGWHHKIEVVGGPFHNCPNGVVGINLTEVSVKQETFHMPIRDFSVPDSPELLTKALKTALRASLEGKTVYAGCGAGWGRTGLFLAILAKVCGVSDPIEYVRSNYTRKAVETPEQEEFVKTFQVGQLQTWLAGEAAWRTFFWWIR